MRAAAAAPSRRQLSKWEREQRHHHMLYLAGAALVLLVAVIFGGGLLYDNLVRANESVAQLGPENITAGQLLDEVRPTARAIDSQAKQVGAGATSARVSQYVDGQKRQVPDQAINDLLDATLIEREANRRGITVSPSEVDARVQQTIASYEAASNPTPQTTPDTAAAEDSGVSATPPAAAAPTSDLSRGTPTPLPTLQPGDYDAALKKYLDQIGLTEQEERKGLTRGILREKVQQAIGEEQVPANQEQVHARHIVVASEDQARDVLNQLQAGADFASLAQQVSTDAPTKESGGDLGWFPRGVKTKAFDDAAFALQPDQLSDVVSNGNSFEIIQVVERQTDRPAQADLLMPQRTQASNTWLSDKRAGPDVKLTFNPSQRDWVLSKIGVRP